MEFLACSSFKNCIQDPTSACGLLLVIGSQLWFSLWESWPSTPILKELGPYSALVSSLPETKILHLNILPGILLSCHLLTCFSYVCLDLEIFPAPECQFSCFVYLLEYLLNVEPHWYNLHWLPFVALISRYCFTCWTRWFVSTNEVLGNIDRLIYYFSL